MLGKYVRIGGVRVLVDGDVRLRQCHKALSLENARECNHVLMRCQEEA